MSFVISSFTTDSRSSDLDKSHYQQDSTRPWHNNGEGGDGVVLSCLALRPGMAGNVKSAQGQTLSATINIGNRAERLSIFAYRLTVNTNDRFIGLTAIDYCDRGHWASGIC